MDTAEVKLVTDSIVCRRASEALGPIPKTNPPEFADVVVIALGPTAYFVHSAEHTYHAGEFVCLYATMNSEFRDVAYWCG